MAKVYYFGTDGKRHGPSTEQAAQAWYASGYFSSDVKFQVTSADGGDHNGLQYTLAQLIEMNGKSLPFYFAPEKDSRESKQTLQQLVQDVEALRVSYQEAPRRDNSEDKETIALLQSQVASLVESQSDMLRQLDALSSQKENSPIAPQLEKRVNELKKRVDEQEKNYASMRKELSAVVSKCDRNDTKLERLMEKQQEVEGAVTGYDKRISDLKSSEKSIRESLNECEQNAASGAERLKSIDGELNEIKKEIEEQKKLSTTHTSKMSKSRKELDEVFGIICEHSEKLSGVEQREASLREEIKEVKEASKRASKVQTAAPVTTRNPIEKVADSAPPWERDDKKVSVRPEAAIKVEPIKTESSPWAANKAAGDTVVKKEEGAPWASGKTSVDAKAKKTEVSAAVKKESAPWDSDETKVDAEAMKTKENRAPWDDDKNQPEPEPWNQTSGSSKKDSVGRKNAGKGISIDQKNGVTPAKVEKSAAAAKPVSREKDWNAICRDLDSDEEEKEGYVEGHEETGDSMVKSLQCCQNFTHDFIETLKVYLATIESGAYQMLRAWNSKCPFDTMFLFQERLTPTYVGFAHIRDALRRELRRLADQSAYCAACDFVMTTPSHLYQHLSSQSHHDYKTAVYNEELEKLNKLIAVVLHKCLGLHQQLFAWAEEDIGLGQRASDRAAQNQPVAALLHPTQAFQVKVVAELTKFQPDGFIEGMPVEVVKDEDLRRIQRERLAEIRAWLECKKRRRQLQADMDKHLAEGPPGCGACYLQFASAEEYFQHVVSYGHAIRDQSLFAMCMWQWKGNERWDAAM